MSPYDKLLDEARGRPFACIVGWPVEHSRSPALHGFWLKQHGIDGHYGRLPVEPNRAALEELVAFLRRTPNARGCNLTLPHKIDIMPLLDRIHPGAARIGAVNTVIKQPDGTPRRPQQRRLRLPRSPASKARRTGAPRPDRSWCWAPAARRAPSSPPWSTPACPSCAWSTARRARRSISASPSRRRTAGASPSSAGTSATQTLDGVTLLVNTTSLGMKGQPPLELDLARLPRTAVVNDIVYVPLETGLLAAARARGNRCIDGLGMLLHQGRVGFEAWFGPKVDGERRAAPRRRRRSGSLDDGVRSARRASSRCSAPARSSITTGRSSIARTTTAPSWSACASSPSTPTPAAAPMAAS